MKARWLHISDFHFAGGDAYDRNVVLNALVASLPRFVQQGHGADLVFATGDIAQSGKASEYQAVSDFFDAVLKALGLGRERLFVVPGNHDVDRAAGVGLSRSLSKREEADIYFGPAHPKHHITDKQAAFLTWYKDYFTGIRRFPEASSCGPVERVSLPGGTVGVLPINSALFCAGDDDHGKLWVGRRCLEEALKCLKGLTPDLSVALLHHPLDWLHGVEASNIRAALERDVDLILRGHLHENTVAATRGTSGEALHIAAGAAYQTRQWPNRAFFASVDGAEVTLFPIRYEDNPEERWTVDPSLFPDPPYSGRFPLARLAQSQTAPLPPPPLTTAPAVARSNIPALRNLSLVGRDDLLATITARLGEPAQDAVLVLRGAPGVGKSELAREHARRNRHRYPGGCFVIEAGNRAIAVGLAELGRRYLDLSFPPDLPLEDQAVRVLRALHAAPSLLIFDNVVAVEDALPWLPPAGAPCHTLLTSLLDQWGLVAPDLVVSPLPDDAALALVERIAGPEIARSQGAALLRMAGGLPVQLVPASATLKKAAGRGRAAGAASLMAAEATQSFDAVYERLADPARLLLHAAARLDSQAIDGDELSAHLREGAGWTDQVFNEHLTQCLDLHLLDGADTLRMHQLLAAFLNDHDLSASMIGMVPKVAAAQARAMVAAAREVARQPNRADLATRLFRFQPEVDRWTILGVEWSADDAQWMQRALHQLGRFEEALAWALRSVERAEAKSSEGIADHGRFGVCLNNVGSCLSRLGRWSEAQPWLERAVAAAEQGDGDGHVDHQNLGVSLHEVGICLLRRGEHAAAQEWLERAVAAKERGDVHGRVDHESFGTSLHQVGMCLSFRGEHATAQAWFERAVAAAERGDVHGRVDHGSLGRSLHQVGICLSSRGEHAAAQERFERAVASAERGDVHGRVDHESLAISLDAVGHCLLELNRPDEAAVWLERAEVERAIPNEPGV
ncbi:tetratricopeptide repeat protein [Azospirillum griseum]|uniref:Tetratricopeptide repeat protein n=1 Tax=Azospirillum griseum TaxID=2496639 RepID=A0A431VC66_9PROT|nr:tetratricopeptide repeat protein [Azospirillum griseum]RTR16153.1 tetratricopeptide repeat protein [Azospirillum griseum]